MNEDELMDKLITSEELSEALGVPTRTLDQWAYLGKGPTYIKVGRHRRYRTEDVESWLHANRVTPVARVVGASKPRVTDADVRATIDAYRTLLNSGYVGGDSYAELAKIMGCSRATIGRRFKKARELRIGYWD